MTTIPWHSRKCLAATALYSVLGASLFTACSTPQTQESPTGKNDDGMTSTNKLTAASTAIIHPEIWPRIDSAVPKEAAIETRIAKLITRMSTEEKVGQIIQAEIGYITPKQANTYHIGSILNGGGSFPNGNKYASAEEWTDFADSFYHASVDTSNGRTAIPIIWGSDAVHGHNNVYGATLLPHNIGLGAANNPALIRRLGEITAREVAATGLDWTFAPTLAVVRDDRWGRTYESYSEDPEIVASYAKQVVEGIQGVYGEANFLRGAHLLANAKHYLGDGGTFEGRDQGDNRASETELRDIHAAGYFSAIEAGAQIVMASFSSWQGDKLHAHKALLTDVLKDRIGFDGFVISDWNGHQQVPGCSASSCAAAINAGIDMVMVTEDWEAFFHNTLAQVHSGEIAMSRLNDAVRRILRVKARAGILDSVAPSERALAGNANILGAKEHRATARQAVRESLVLLKNNTDLLPLHPKQRFLMLGDGAHNIGKQSGGWTLSWQGTGNENADFPNGESIYQGFEKAISASGGSVQLVDLAEFDLSDKPDVAIMVYGEDPYAEFQGDRKTLAYIDKSERELAALKTLNAQGIPVVSVFLSGRPMWVNPYINHSQAFVAAWLPGSEGGGIADVLLRDANGRVQHDFRGRLSFSWPKTAIQFELNASADNYDPLFPLGYGLGYTNSAVARTSDLPQLPEVSGIQGSEIENDGIYFSNGRTLAPWNFYLHSEAGSAVLISGNEAKSRGGEIIARLADRHRQGDSKAFIWPGTKTGKVSLVSSQILDLSRETNGGLALAIQMRVDATPQKTVTLAIHCIDECEGQVPIQSFLNRAAVGQWTTLRLPLNCFEDAGANMHAISSISLATSGALNLAISDVRLVSASAGADDCPLNQAPLG